jgi:hypothetical protein
MSPYSAECFYRIAKTHYDLGEYRLARQYCERLVGRDPDMKQAVTKKAIQLNGRVRQSVYREGPTGILLILTGVVATIGLGALFLRRNRPAESASSPGGGNAHHRAATGDMFA